tara:strand:+ start:6883 stop:8082 length:1200 start_codon:yes stop_codon:yes gene_type:complete
MSTRVDQSLHDVLIVGGGASGLMCAIHAGYNGHKVLVLEKGPKVGLKILVSGGGRCNFTNQSVNPDQHFLSDNPHFCISALKRYPPERFIEMVENHGIDYHEKKLGQLFCDHSAKDIVAMLLSEAEWAGVEIRTGMEVLSIKKNQDDTFSVSTAGQTYQAGKVVLASGGLSMPKIASDLAFRAANDFGLEIVAPRAALVPLTWNSGDKESFADLSGISLDAEVSCEAANFRENILFTHRGLSGPSILQISSFWREGGVVFINLLPDLDAESWLIKERASSPKVHLSALLKKHFPNRLVDYLSKHWFSDQKIGSLTHAEVGDIAKRLNSWPFKPGGSEGYRTAEVTLGGISTNEVSSKTFAVRKVPGLYAIGEALDVAGWLGGYNFQWAWASAYSCAMHL